ncbi:PRC-barrel domain-containing protein [Paeniglutamicibacter sp. NPDC091659]|uniref:PRC-barrel domain-containing protein n=1 Tax=Paeniglutamicibacter sp. NPDC091659 TaxID=3364389 RepID=UPI003820B999
MLGHGYVNALKQAKSGVFGPRGEKIGTLGNIFMDVGTGDADFVTVHLGLFGAEECFVSLEGAEIAHGRLHVAFGKDKIRHAPHLDSAATLTDEDKHLLDLYYARGIAGTAGAGTQE